MNVHSKNTKVVRAITIASSSAMLEQAQQVTSHLNTTRQKRNLLHMPRHRLNTYRRQAIAIAGPYARNSLWILSAIQTPPKLISGAFQRHFCSHSTNTPAQPGPSVSVLIVLMLRDRPLGTLFQSESKTSNSPLCPSIII